MSGEDEVLVIINKPEEEKTEKDAVARLMKLTKHD